MVLAIKQILERQVRGITIEQLITKSLQTLLFNCKLFLYLTILSRNCQSLSIVISNMLL